jgi:hypothetical protein
MKKINLKHIHNLNEEALRGLDFYEEEMRILQERLEDVAKDNYDKEVMLKVEHFQNQLIIQRNNIDELRHAIHDHLSIIKGQLENSNEYISENADLEETTLYEQYHELEKTINILRKEFNHFAAEWI